jgi:hypothetical protein
MINEVPPNETSRYGKVRKIGRLWSGSNRFLVLSWHSTPGIGWVGMPSAGERVLFLSCPTCLTLLSSVAIQAPNPLYLFSSVAPVCSFK